MNIEQARFNMIEQQIRTADVFESRVLETLAQVRREDFVPEALQDLAFADIQVPLGYGQCMLTPITEARVLQALQLKRGQRVLEIGAGSGYMAALMAAQGAHVLSLECVPELAAQAQANLEKAGIEQVRVAQADGASGYAANAPYDWIVASGSLENVPQAWLDQLKIGGRAFVFLGAAPVMRARVLSRMTETEFEERNVFETNVPALQLGRQPTFAW